MKYRFSIIAPHPDDEMIGCRQFIKSYGSCVDNVIFITNGEHPLTHFHDMVENIQTRRKESETWIKKMMPQADVIYLNVPDALVMMNPEHNYGLEIFESVNGISQFDHLSLKIKNLVSDNIVLVPNFEPHPTHSFTFTLCQMLNNKRIYYAVHALMNKPAIKHPGFYFSKLEMLGDKYISYYYILTKSELERKKKEFQTYYNSQYLGFLETGIDISNWENYLSEVHLKLADEDKTFKLDTGVSSDKI